MRPSLNKKVSHDQYFNLMVNKNNARKSGHGVAVGVGLGMLTALSAGAYYLYGTKEGAKKRAQIRGWALKAKGEVLEKLEGLKEVNEETYNDVIARVMKKYQGLKSLDQDEVAKLVGEMKKYWKNIKGNLNTSGANKKTRKVSKRSK